MKNTNIIEKDIKDIQIEVTEKILSTEKTMATLSGTVATLSTLITAGNLIIGNGFQVVQTGGSAAAMVGYLVGYAKSISKSKKELEILKQDKPSLSPQDRLEIIKLEIEKIKTSQKMSYNTMCGFLVSALGHIAEMIIAPEPRTIVKGAICSTLSVVIAILNMTMQKNYKKRLEYKSIEEQHLKELIDLEELSKQPIPELVEDNHKVQK